MFNSYFFCPNFIERQSRITDEFAYDIALNHFYDFMNDSDHKIILDENKFIISLYRKASSDPSLFEKKGTTERLVRYLSSGKVNTDISSHKIFDSELEEFVKLVSHTPTTYHKIIITDQPDEYKPYIDILNISSITILESRLYKQSRNDLRLFYFSYHQLTQDLLKSCKFLASTKATKLEDEYNDYIRDLLKMVGYIVHDQHRSGRSQNSFNNLGELDLVVENAGQDVSIIEALRAKSINRTNIESHYKKLIDNYNPQRLPHTYLVVYYHDGSNFTSFQEKYQEYIESIDGSSMYETKDIKLGRVTLCDTGEGNAIRAFKQAISIDSDPCFCTHILVNLSS
ncbi:hypothetical protein [Vibrio parahaemolyticus]|uniref:hypothetical protein n=1 Tax=Vibrio parahaemolyticus TaxID=670 RepID=UPI0030F02DC7